MQAYRAPPIRPGAPPEQAKEAPKPGTPGKPGAEQESSSPGGKKGPRKDAAGRRMQRRAKQAEKKAAEEKRQRMRELVLLHLPQDRVVPITDGDDNGEKEDPSAASSLQWCCDET